MKRSLLFIFLAVSTLLSAQTLELQYAMPEYAVTNLYARIASADLSIKLPFDNLSLIAGFSLSRNGDQSKFGNPAIGIKKSFTKISASLVFWIPSADNKNNMAVSAFVATVDTRFGCFVPEAVPLQFNANAWTKLPLGLDLDAGASALALFVDDEKVLAVDGFEFFFPISLRVSKKSDDVLEFGAAWSGIWYATEDLGDRLSSQARFDAGIWFGNVKPTVEAAFPLSDNLQKFLDSTLILKLVFK